MTNTTDSAHLLKALLALTPVDQAMSAPGQITFTAYKGNRMIPANGADHREWIIGIGKDHTARLIMHKDDFVELQRQGDAARSGGLITGE